MSDNIPEFGGEATSESLAYKLERNTGSFFERLEKLWQKKWFRLLRCV